jgi:hypothetical protein
MCFSHSIADICTSVGIIILCSVVKINLQHLFIYVQVCGGRSELLKSWENLPAHKHIEKNGIKKIKIKVHINQSCNVCFLSCA